MVGAMARMETQNGRPVGGTCDADDPGLAAVLAARLGIVLDSGEALQRRICQSRTSVEIRIADGVGSVTLLLDRFPPRVVNGPEPAAIVIVVSARQAELLARGDLHLPTEMSSGTVRFRGPVRRFLAIEPILRRRLGEMG